VDFYFFLFLLDVDNNLVGQRPLFAADLGSVGGLTGLDQAFSAPSERARLLAGRSSAGLREQTGLADYLASLQGVSNRTRRTHPDLLAMSGVFCWNTRLAARLFPPRHIEAVAHIEHYRAVRWCSRTGDHRIQNKNRIFSQPRKIQRSGIWDVGSGAAS